MTPPPSQPLKWTIISGAHQCCGFKKVSCSQWVWERLPYLRLPCLRNQFLGLRDGCHTSVSRIRRDKPLRLQSNAHFIGNKPHCTSESTWVGLGCKTVGHQRKHLKHNMFPICTITTPQTKTMNTSSEERKEKSITFERCLNFSSILGRRLKWEHNPERLLGRHSSYCAGQECHECAIKSRLHQ